jgi:GT2 family glycosyltransferase
VNAHEGQEKGVSIVIPNYNGEALLGQNLPSVVAAIEAWGGPGEIIIVDDSSSDGSCRLIRESFPSVRLIVNQRNMGFSKTCNIGMAEAIFPILVCINTDVKVEEHLIPALAGHFSDPEVFAVTPRVIVEREGKNQGAVFARFGRGFIKAAFAPADEKLPSRENLYAIGACVAYEADKFRLLHGYCEIYTPYLFEDVDICYRAWKRGWKSIHEPSATVWHYNNATLGKAKRRLNKVIYFRNRFIFHWVNLSDPSYLLQNLCSILLHLAVSFLWFNFVYYEAFFGALGRWREIVALRRAERPHRRLRDGEILRRTAHVRT